MQSFIQHISEGDINAPIQKQTLTPVDTAEKGGIYKHANGNFAIPTLKRTFLRDKGTTSPSDWWLKKNHPATKDPIGWFANKHNIALGWAIYALDKADKIWLKEGGITNLTGIVRISSYKGSNVGKFNLKTGTWAPIVGEETYDEKNIKFEKASAFDRVVLDTQEAFQVFGFTFKIE